MSGGDSSSSRIPKLPFLSRSRPQWSRRSVAGATTDPFARSATSLDSVDRPPASQSSQSARQHQLPHHQQPPSEPVAGLPKPAAATTSKSELPTIDSSNSQAPSQGNTALTESSLAESLVKRIVGRLPTYANAPLGKDDDVVRQACATLFSTAKRKPQVVISPLLAELDSLTKPPHYSPEEYTSVDLLRSQLILLNAITTCAAHYWVASDTPDRRARRPNTSNGPSPELTFLDPLPLDEPLVHQALHLAILILSQHSSHDDLTAPQTSERVSVAVQFHTQLRILASGGTLHTGDLPTTRQRVVGELFAAAGKLVYFLSASNWPLVFGRVKAKIGQQAAQTADETDPMEMRLLEWCCLDRKRLSSVIQELCGTFFHLKRPAQAALSVVLRRAIWSWIDSFGSEFSALAATGRRLEGGPEMLFDIIFSLSESSKRKTFAWPVMAMLLVCCPDILGKLVLGEGGKASLSKKMQFFEGLRKALKSPKLADAAAACYGDICRAAACTRPDANDPSALRMLIEDLDFDLKSILLDPSKPFLTPEGVPDTPVTTDLLVSLYRLHATSVAETTFPSLVQLNSAEASKLTAVYACAALIRDGKQLPWSPSPAALLDSMAPAIRRAFIDLAAWHQSETVQPGLARVYRTGAEVEHSTRNELARSILRIWIADLRFLTHGIEENPTDESRSWSSILLAISDLLEDSNHRSIRTLAVAALTELNSSGTEEIETVRDSYFHHCALEVTSNIIRYLLQSKNNPEEEMDALNLLIQDSGRYHSLVQAGDSLQLTTLLAASWEAHWAVMECALFVSSSSRSAENRRLAVMALNKVALILDALDSRGAIHLTRNNSIQLFAAVYGNVRSSSLTFEQQREIATEGLRNVKQASVGMLAGWDETMRRWRELTTVIFSRVHDDSSENSSDTMRREQIESLHTPEEQFDEWQRVTAILLAQMAACTQTINPPTLESVVGSEALPARFYRRTDRLKQADRLIQELVDLLVSDSPSVRKSVREALGSSLPLSQFTLFFKHIRAIVGHFFDNEKGIPVAEEAFTVFIRETMLVMQSMFERVVDPLPLSSNVTLDSLLLSCTIYVQRLGFDSEAYQLKIQVCQLCDAVFSRRVRGDRDSTFRNALLEHFVSWASEEQPSYADEATEQLRAQLDATCLKAMVPLLSGLVIHSRDLDSTMSVVETDHRLFERYNDFFAYTLFRLSSLVSTTLSPLLSTSETTKSRPVSITASPSRQHAIDALANLINANPNPAFQHFVEMGLSDNIPARAAYLETLVKVIEAGTRFEGVSGAPKDDTFQRLVALLRQPDLTLAITLCEICTPTHFEDLSELFLKVFDTPRSIARFLKAVIEVEVKSTEHESTLFRGNSFATRILTAYARARGYHYLRNTLKDLLATICSKPPEFGIDFDPHNPTPADDVASRNLERVTEAFLLSIEKSIDQVPTAIREICHYISEVVAERFPESIFTAIGGFIFLRFINPAIVSPETIDLDPPTDNRDIRRGLVMITKVIQSLANNTRFGAKEPAMRKLNDFMDDNIFGMTRFLQAISHYNPAEELGAFLGGDLPEDDIGLDEEDRHFLHQFLFDNMDKLGMELLQGKPPAYRRWHDGSQDLSTPIGSRTWDRVTTLIASLGPPPDSAIRAMIASGEDFEIGLRRFMAKNEARLSPSGALWSRVFFETRVNKSGNPTLVFLPHRIKAETADLESLVFYVLQRLMKAKGPVEILIDCSNFAETNEVPIQWMLQFVNFIPSTTAQQVQRIIIFNPNTRLKSYLHKLSRVVSLERLDGRQTVAVASLAELSQYFNNIESVLPAATVALSKEKRTVFHHITAHHQIRVELPVSLKVGARTLVVSTVKRIELFSDIKCTLDDVIEISDIEEIRKISIGPEGDGISIRVAGEPRARRFMVLANNRRDELFYALNQARLDAPPHPPSISRDHLLQPTDVSAVLINTILFNLCSSNESLRSLAYDLLGALVRSYGIAGFDDLGKVGSVHIPMANLTFLSSVSERLSTAIPSHALGVLVQFTSGLGLASSVEGAALVHCARPWLPHLQVLVHTPREERSVVQQKIRRSIRQIIQVAFKQPAIHGALVSRVWPGIGKIDFLQSVLIDEGVRAITAFDVGSETDPCSIVSQMLVAASGGLPLRGKILSRLRLAVARTGTKSVAVLSKSPEWPEIVALLRLDLALSFDSKVQAQMFFPDILHICVAIVAVGPLFVRHAVCSLLVNTIHSLAKAEGLQGDRVRLGHLVDALSGPRSEYLFGLSEDVNDESMAWTVTTAGEELVRLLADILEAVAPTVDTANAWRARWTGLATSCCFQYNPALQPRAFLTLALAGQTDMDGDLLFQMTTTLRANIRLSPSRDNSLAVSIIRCIARALPGLALDNGFWPNSFWLSVSLLQISQPAITGAAIVLLSASLEGLAKGGWLTERPFTETLLEFRQDQDSNSPPAQLDDASGVDFRQSLSFALATILAKACRRAPISQATTDVLFELLTRIQQHEPKAASNGVVSSTEAPRMVHSSYLGIFLLLVPSALRRGRLNELWTLVGFHHMLDRPRPDFALYVSLASRLTIEDSESAILALALLSGLAHVADTDAEHVAVLGLFAGVAQRFPDVAPYLYDSILPVLRSVISTSDNLEALDAAQAVVQIDTGRPQSNSSDGSDVLRQLGFPALSSKDFAAFTPSELGAPTPLQCEISEIVSLHLAQILQNPT